MSVMVGIVDDDKLFARSLCALIDTFPSFRSVVDASNGEELLRKLDSGTTLPEILLVDVNMKVMGGLATASAISEKYPQIKMAALSMKDDDITIISMIKAGCSAYLVKDISPEELERALSEIAGKGYYNGDRYNVNCRRLIIKDQMLAKNRIMEKEKQFLQLSCSDLTYKQIAAEMHLSERTIDGYREVLFEKLNVQSRVGMVMEALKRELVLLPPNTTSH
ncbi:MAG TPA: response regulator transcription factor [Puia sp.]